MRGGGPQHIKLVIEKNIVLKGFDSISKKGFIQLPNSVLENKNLSDGAIIIYSLLLYHAWYKDSCFPGQETIAKLRGKTSRWVRTCLTELKSNGLLDIQRRGLGKTNIYVLKSRVER